MIDLIVKILVNAVALIVAAKIVPEIKLPIPNNFDKPEQWVGILVIALIFALINSYLRPILKTVAMPISVLTMGIASFVINVVLLFAVAELVYVLRDTLHTTFTIASFPPTIDYTAIGAAVVAAVVISIVSTVLNILLVPRRAIGL